MIIPSISIIIPTNRVDNYLDEAVDSCLSQSFSDFELIIVFNGLTASQVETLRNRYKDERVVVLQSKLNHINHSLNVGLQAARAELIARMDADDISYPDRLRLQYELMVANPEITVCSGDYHEIDAAGRIVKLIRLPSSNSDIRKVLYFKNPICHPAVMMRVRPIREAGGYLGYVKGEDYDVWARLSIVAETIFVNISVPLIKYRIENRRDVWRRDRRKRVATLATQTMLFWETFNLLWLLGAVSSIARVLSRDFTEFFLPKLKLK